MCLGVCVFNVHVQCNEQTTKIIQSFYIIHIQQHTTGSPRCCHMYFTSFLYPTKKPQLKVYVFIASKNLSKVSCVVQFLSEELQQQQLTDRKKNFSSNSSHEEKKCISKRCTTTTQEGFERVNYYG